MTSKQRRFERTEGYVRVLAEHDAIERDQPRGDSGIIWSAERHHGAGLHVDDQDYLLEVYHEVWYDLRPRVCGGTCPYCGEELTVEVGGNAESGPVTEAYCRNPRCSGGDPDGPDWDAISDDADERPSDLIPERETDVLREAGWGR